jgi:steroid 5-alpha reductase family enzyme
MPKKTTIIRLSIFLMILFVGGWLFTNDWAITFQYSISVLMIILTALWLISLVIKDASIIDIFWGFGFVIVGWLYAIQQEWAEMGIRNFILLGLITVWGLRLAIYLAIRNLGKGEDYRYAQWRKENGKSWWWLSFIRVFALQGFLLWIISAIYLPALSIHGELVFWDYLGIGFWLIGFFFEAVGDWQMMQFKKHPTNKGKVMDQGLWKYTRHPNYFGDTMIWWGFFFFGLTHPQGVYYIFCPVIMTFFLINVSGVAMLEEGLKKTKPHYAEYIRRTSTFLPWWPKD